MKRLLAPLACSLLFACSSPSPAAVSDTGVAADAEPAAARSDGLQYEGSILTHTSSTGARVELSAPLFPDMTGFQQFQSPTAYPAMSAADRAKLVDERVKTFDELLALCAPTHPGIVAWKAGDAPLSLAQLQSNYDEVARCGYEQFGAKPYWVPQLLADVDVCEQKLGADWHLPTVPTIELLTADDFAIFASTMTALPGNDWFPVQFYYQLRLYARDADGKLVLANLAPATTHVSPLPVSGAAMNELYVGDADKIGVRCIRDARIE